MAGDHAVSDGHPEMDYPEHERTYALFTGLFKWGSVFCACAVILLAFLTL
jgi:hypothetical protein